MEFIKYELVSAPTVLSPLNFANLITGNYKTERAETYFTYCKNPAFIEIWPIGKIGCLLDL